MLLALCFILTSACARSESVHQYECTSSSDCARDYICSIELNCAKVDFTTSDKETGGDSSTDSVTGPSQDTADTQTDTSADTVDTETRPSADSDLTEGTETTQLSDSEETNPVDSNVSSCAIFIETRDSCNLYKMNLDGSDIILVRDDFLSKVEDIKPDLDAGKIYASRWESGPQVFSANLDGSGSVKPIYDTPSNGFGGQSIAIDFSANLLFAAIYYGGLYRAPFDGIGPWTQIVTADALYPGVGLRGSVNLDTGNEMVYFRSVQNGDDHPEGKAIWWVGYNGENLEKLYDSVDVGAWALDIQSSKMYFTDVSGQTAGIPPFWMFVANLLG